jgi:hypothetical protein
MGGGQAVHVGRGVTGTPDPGRPPHPPRLPHPRRSGAAQRRGAGVVAAVVGARTPADVAHRPHRLGRAAADQHAHRRVTEAVGVAPGRSVACSSPSRAARSVATGRRAPLPAHRQQVELVVPTLHPETVPGCSTGPCGPATARRRVLDPPLPYAPHRWRTGPVGARVTEATTSTTPTSSLSWSQTARSAAKVVRGVLASTIGPPPRRTRVGVSATARANVPPSVDRRVPRRPAALPPAADRGR